MPIIIGNMKSLNKHYDELWFVMRSMDWFYKEKVTERVIDKNYRFLMQPNVKVIDDLSPSKELFYLYLKKKKNFNWNERSFFSEYAPRFTKELIENEEAKFRLNQLWSLDRAGKTVLIVCSCAEEKLCHRSILAGILYGAGCNVITDNPVKDYLRFYDDYRIIESRYKNKIN